MSAMRNRTKENFPMVLLTLLSIVQALALELIWSHVREADHLFEASLLAIVSWVQIAATLLGLVLIWVVYASNAMRFRWVPATSDSVYPFVIGIMEFMLVETLDPGESGRWMMLMALIFGTMVLVSHRTMKRARADGDNAAFFDRYRPATLRDFIPQISIVAAMALVGLFVQVTNIAGTLVLLAVSATFGILAWQFHVTASFWRRTVIEEPGS